MSGSKFSGLQRVVVDGGRAGVVVGVPLLDYRPRYLIHFDGGFATRWVREALLEPAETGAPLRPAETGGSEEERDG